MTVAPFRRYGAGRMTTDHHRAGIARLGLATVLALVVAGLGMAQEQALVTTYDVPEKKRPSYFREPHKTTPASQLVYAGELVQRGWKRTARKQYRALVHQWHDAKEAPTAQKVYAELLEEAGYYRDAFEEYQYLVSYFGGLFPYETILDRQFKIAEHLRTATWGRFLFLRGFRRPKVALPLYTRLLENAPHWKRADEIQYGIGLIYEDMGERHRAVAAFEALDWGYPDSRLREEASFRRSQVLLELAQRSPRDEGSSREALSGLTRFLRDFPDSRYADTTLKALTEVKERLAGMYYKVARYYDTIASRPTSAVIAYRDVIRSFPTSSFALKARERMDAISEQQQKGTNDAP